MITCVIQYTLDPHAITEFEKYATTWPPIIERCGGRLTGFYLPKERANDFALALLDFDSLADYERYRERLAADPGAQANVAFVRQARAVLAERRSFRRKVSPEAEGQALGARRGDAHTAAARAALDPAQLEQPGRDRGGQGAVQVPAALGPVDTLAGEVPP